MRRRLAAAIFLLAAPAHALTAAATQACWVPYSAFEERIPHWDLERCPGDEPRAERGFCRAALQGAEFLVYVFEHNDQAGGPCLVRVLRQDFNSFAALNGTAYVSP